VHPRSNLSGPTRHTKDALGYPESAVPQPRCLCSPQRCRDSVGRLREAARELVFQVPHERLQPCQKRIKQSISPCQEFARPKSPSGWGVLGPLSPVVAPSAASRRLSAASSSLVKTAVPVVAGGSATVDDVGNSQLVHRSSRSEYYYSSVALVGSKLRQ
jgi:hypothetical protein